MTGSALEFARLPPLMVWAAAVTALTMAAAVIVERTAVRRSAGAEPPPHAAVPPARAACARGRRNGARRAPGQSRETSARSRAAADRTAHRGSRPGANRQDPRDRRGAVGVPARRPLPAELVVVAARTRAARARAHASQDYTAQLIAALDDPHPDVRAAALDGLADMHDLTALQAIVVRVHDTSLHRGRRGAALKAFGFRLRAVPAGVVGSRSRKTASTTSSRSAICGTARSRPVLCRWTRDTARRGARDGI